MEQDLGMKWWAQSIWLVAQSVRMTNSICIGDGFGYLGAQERKKTTVLVPKYNLVHYFKLIYN